MIYSDEFVQFISENWNLFGQLHLSEPLFLFFVLKNLYHTILSDLSEFSVVDELTFNSFVNGFDEHQNSDINEFNTFVPFIKNNFLLTDTQKSLIEALLTLRDVNDEERGYLKSFRVYYSRDDRGRSYILVCESQLYYIVKELTLTLFNEKCESGVNKRLALDKCVKYFNLLKDKGYFCKVNSAIESELSKAVNSRILTYSLCFLLLYFNTSFTGVSKRLIESLNSDSLSTLFKCTLMVNRLILSHPKDVNLWEIKAILTKLWFSRLNLKLRRCVLQKNGVFSSRPPSKGLLYSHLVKTIYRLFTDKLILADKTFTHEVLSLKPFNNNVVCYLKHEYECVIDHVVEPFMIEVKKVSTLNSGNIFQEFTYLTAENKYRTTLNNAIFKLFYQFYRNLLNNFSFPGLFILLVNLIKTRTYSRMQSSVINYSDLYTSCFLYTRVDDVVEETLGLCDRMIKTDTHNCWIENKSRLLIHLLDLTELRPFLVYVLNKHIATWHVFTNSISAICNCGIDNYSRSVRICNMNRKKNAIRKRLMKCKIDQYKSESVLIKKVIRSEFKIDDINFGYLDGHGFVSVKHVYLDSLEVLKRFQDSEIDCFLNAFSQLLSVLVHLFRNVYTLKRKSSVDLNTASFTPLVDTVRLVSRYAASVPRLGSRASVLVGVSLAKRMRRRSRLLCYKHYSVSQAEDHGTHRLDSLVAALSRLLLSQPFRFYVHWTVSSQAKVELLRRQVLRLK
ncbi:conserved hypothetical protein [Theileria orientalis strain Shintoku]|uniref:Uncharacterized protein n=1 Tax=Theileria orientalis strain Shintoku TaxID=869250 RepID=J7MBS2_THEOR|nr:conserved hypothetical protein [Theileria orientalis strain Shintoku]BAM38552.1 conserved hypothetical protein [Theileria orientalis strain Shintoku]|eukprot:XP_009688853.1 conserved hypothetical protein [Theileria orientalis strain Shintoku]